MNGMSDDEKRRERRERMIAGTAGAGVGAAVGGVPGAMLGFAAGVALEPLAARVWDELSRDGRHRAGEVLHYAQTASSLNDEEFERLITRDEQSRLLSGIAIAAGTRTVWSDKLRTLGYSLNHGLLATEEAIVNTEQMILAAIADIEQPHLALLDLIVAYEPIRTVGQTEPRRLNIPADSWTELPGGNETWRAGRREWTQTQIIAQRPRLGPVLGSLLGTLQRHGLVREDVNTDENIQKFSNKLQDATARAIGPRNRGKLGGLTSAPRVRLGPHDMAPPSWSPTLLGEQVWERFRDAGAEVPDQWTVKTAEPLDD